LDLKKEVFWSWTYWKKLVLTEKHPQLKKHSSTLVVVKWIFLSARKWTLLI
jgi:hypothetical protein